MNLALINRLIKNKLGQQTKEEVALPLKTIDALQHLRLGAVVNFDKALASFLMAKKANTFLKEPNDNYTVASYGKIHDGSFIIHRFYLSQGQLESRPQYILQVLTNDNNLAELRLLSFLQEVQPADNAEWDLWLKGNLEEGQAPLLTGRDLVWEDISFPRIWGGQTAFKVPTKIYNEYLTAGGGEERTTSENMLFGRTLSDNQNEWLYVSAVSHEDERWIEAYVALDLSVNEIDIY